MWIGSSLGKVFQTQRLQAILNYLTSTYVYFSILEEVQRVEEEENLVKLIQIMNKTFKYIASN